MSTPFVSGLCLLAVTSMTSFSYASAKAIAGGKIADGAFPSVEHTHPLTIEAESKWPVPPHDSPDLFYGKANVSGPVLKARAIAHRGLQQSPFDFRHNVSGFARAIWTDQLVLENKDLYAGIFQTGTAFAYFSPHANGFFDDRYVTNGLPRLSFATLSASVTDLEFRYKGGSASTLTQDEDFLELGIVFPLAAFNHPVYYTMDLSVTAAVYDFGEHAIADYSHTATLPRIIIADAYGTPIPGLPEPIFVGESGLSYSGSTTVPAPIGDYNGNGVVDSADYVVWRKSVGQTNDLSADGNNDEQIDIEDYKIWQARFGQIIDYGEGSATATTVPEPAAGALLLTGTLLVSTRRRLRAARHPSNSLTRGMLHQSTPFWDGGLFPSTHPFDGIDLTFRKLNSALGLTLGGRSSPKNTPAKEPFLTSP